MSHLDTLFNEFNRYLEAGETAYFEGRYGDAVDCFALAKGRAIEAGTEDSLIAAEGIDGLISLVSLIQAVNTPIAA